MSASADRIAAYAKALFEIAQAEGDLRQVEEELCRVARTLEANDALRDSLTDRALPVELRQGIVEDLLGGMANATTTNLVSMIVGAGRAKDLTGIIDKVVEHAAEAREEAVALVTSAIPLDGKQTKKLAEALSKRFDRKVDVKVIVDQSVLGGLLVRIGDTVIDGTIRSRLDQMKSSL
jgi:F-type H+-transporting ATPase subunit delta